MSSPTPEPPFSSPCVIHDPMIFHGGGERYAIRLAEALDAELYTYKQTASVDGDVEPIVFGNSSFGERLLERSPVSGFSNTITYENFEVPNRHDAVITTGSVAMSVIHNPDQRRYHLLHTPQRWLFDRGPGRYESSIVPLRWIKQWYQHYMRVQTQTAVSRIDDFVVNSEVISRRLETYFRRESTEIIYPPVDTEGFYHSESEGYLLYVGRLEPHKAVGELIEAVNQLEYPLKIAGTGSREDQLRKSAEDHIEFLGFVSEDRKRELLANCNALLFNSDHEDFGIVPVEAFASGKPVIGVNEGFTSYQIEPGVNGVRFERGVANIIDAIQSALERDWDAERIQETADTFDIERFKQQWQSLIYESE